VTVRNEPEIFVLTFIILKSCSARLLVKGTSKSVRERRVLVFSLWSKIGTVTETVQAIALCREAGFGYVTSHRSGEAEDTFLANFTVAMGGGQIKTSSVSRSERIKTLVVRFTRFPIRRPSDPTPNLAFAPDQNVRLWSP